MRPLAYGLEIRPMRVTDPIARPDVAHQLIRIFKQMNDLRLPTNVM